MKKKTTETYELDMQLFSEEGGMGGDGSGDAGADEGMAAADGIDHGPEEETGLESTEEDPEADFEELIKGKYKDQYQSRVNTAINRRLKAESKEAESGRKILNAVAMRYGLKEADPDTVLKALEDDKNLYDDAAAKAGLSPQQYKRMMELEQAKAAREREDDERRKTSIRDQYVQKLTKESEECKKIFPEFDFEKEARNAEFSNLIKAGLDVTKAYKAVHMDELISGGMKMAMQKGTQKVAAAVKANSRRAAEGAVGGSPAVTTHVDYSKMTDEEFDKYVEKVKMGEV